MNTTKTAIFAAFYVLILAAPDSVWGQRGGDRGGDRGGFRGGGGGFRGGPPGGGDRGSRGGPGGGFDPSGFLSRLDRNGNGTIDPDEQQGPAQFLIQRMQSADPSIKPGQPISIKRVTEAFEKMRGQRDDSSRGRDSSRSSSDDSLTPELLVPGFGTEEPPAMLSGFGPAAEMMDVAITEADRKQARETLQRYDRNKDGVLKKDELSSRFSGNPMDFDRNKDGRLTEGELAVRYARRREVAEDSKNDDRRRRDSGREETVEMPDVYGGRKSYRAVAGKDLPEGVPGFFTDKDADQDGQVVMAEFASKWDDKAVSEFFRYDLNRDGVIVATEVVKAVEQGASSPTTSSASTSSSSAGSSSSNSKSSGGGAVGNPDPKMLGYAERIINRYDKNKDGKLVASEWSPMLISPAAADADRDGTVTVKEYAWWMQSRSKR